MISEYELDGALINQLLDRNIVAVVDSGFSVLVRTEVEGASCERAYFEIKEDIPHLQGVSYWKDRNEIVVDNTEGNMAGVLGESELLFVLGVAKAWLIRVGKPLLEEIELTK